MNMVFLGSKGALNHSTPNVQNSEVTYFVGWNAEY